MTDYASRTAAVMRVSNATKELSPAAQRVALQGTAAAGDPFQLANAVEAAAPAASVLDQSVQSAALAAPSPRFSQEPWGCSYRRRRPAKQAHVRA